jgi:hypothetical protein
MLGTGGLMFACVAGPALARAIGIGVLVGPTRPERSH